MLKPVLAAACLCAAAMAEAQATGLSGQQISELVAGATVEIDTPTGTKLPVRYAREGQLAGEARELAWYLGSAVDTGRWWVSADLLCHKWARWFNSEPQCMRLSREGRVIHWRSQDGNSGTATIAVPAVIPASTLLAMPRVPPKRVEEPAPPEAPPALASALQEQAPAEAVPAAGPPWTAAVREAAAEPPPPMARAPVAAVKAIPPPKRAEPRRPAQPTFMVANVRRDDVLNVRSGPSADFDVVGELLPDSRGIAITSTCQSLWCPVLHRTTRGWVNSAYLAPEQSVAVSLHGEVQRGPMRSAAGPALRDSPEAPRSCLTPAARALLARIEQNFGPVRVVSTCRPGAIIAGTGHPSRHASGNAVDFDAGARKAAIVEWLIANHRTGGTMTYAGMDHIHVDIGPHFVSLASGRHWSSWRDGRD